MGSTIADVRAVKLQAVCEPRGKLVVGEWCKQLPFQPQRFFVVSEIPAYEVRGKHGHRTQHQFLVALQGVCVLMVDDGKLRKEMVLGHSDAGVYIPPQIWTTYSCSENTILLVLASALYDTADYVRDYDEFLHMKGVLRHQHPLVRL